MDLVLGLLTSYVGSLLWSGNIFAVLLHIIVPLPRLGMINPAAIISYISMYVFNIALKLLLFLYISVFSLPVIALFVVLRVTLLKHFGIELNFPFELQLGLSILFIFAYASYESKKLDKALEAEADPEVRTYCLKVLKRHSVNVDDRILNKVSFMISPAPDLQRNAVTYGGIFSSPRIVLPTNYRSSFSEAGLVGILSHELGHVLRRDIGFKSMVYSLNLIFIKFSEFVQKWIKKMLEIMLSNVFLVIFALPTLIVLYTLKIFIFIYRSILHFLACSESYVAEFLTDTVAISLVPSAYLNLGLHELISVSNSAANSREKILREGLQVSEQYMAKEVQDSFWVQVLESFSLGITHTHPPIKKRIIWLSSIDHNIEIYRPALSNRLKKLNSFRFGKLYLMIAICLAGYLIQVESKKVIIYMEKIEQTNVEPGQ